MPNYLVKPNEPTVLSHKEHHELSSTNLSLPLTVPTAHVIPEILDIERFNVALGNALSSFPLLAGRIVRPDTPDAPWRIRLTNSGVPVSFIDSDADEIVPIDLTIQPTLPLSEPLNEAGFVNTEGESDEPLFRMTITRFTKLNSTSIGLCMSHIPFDASGLLLFLRLLSQLYQGLDPLDPPPYYEPEAIKFTEPPGAPPPFPPLRELSEAMEFVGFRLTAAQIAEIHNAVTKGMEHLKVPRVDTVMGLLARCLSEVEPESKPIDTIACVINHRGMGIYPDNAALNALIWVFTEIQASKGVDPRDGVLACVTELRKSLARLKDPMFIKDVAAGLGRMLSHVAWAKKGLSEMLTSEENWLVVNNTWKFDWTSAHFGHPGKVRFYRSYPPAPRNVLIMMPNPKFTDGAWVSRKGDMEAAFYIPSNRRKRFEGLFEGYAKSLGMTGSVEFLPYHHAPQKARL